MMKRILIFDNHPDSLRLMHTAGLLQAANEHVASRQEKITSVICAAILIAMIIAAMLWPPLW
jgi:hypothetical protein